MVAGQSREMQCAQTSLSLYYEKVRILLHQTPVFTSFDRLKSWCDLANFARVDLQRYPSYAFRDVYSKIRPKYFL